MDPNATWDELITALEEGNAFDAREAAENLAMWIEREGFIPMGMAVAVLALRNADHSVKLLDLNRAIKP